MRPEITAVAVAAGAGAKSVGESQAANPPASVAVNSIPRAVCHVFASISRCLSSTCVQEHTLLLASQDVFDGCSVAMEVNRFAVAL
jgi:hypothetical protein